MSAGLLVLHGPLPGMSLGLLVKYRLLSGISIVGLLVRYRLLSGISVVGLPVRRRLLPGMSVVGLLVLHRPLSGMAMTRLALDRWLPAMSAAHTTSAAQAWSAQS
jgi:hypothetical protein